MVLRLKEESKTQQATGMPSAAPWDLWVLRGARRACQWPALQCMLCCRRKQILRMLGCLTRAPGPSMWTGVPVASLAVPACCAAGTHVGALAWPFIVDLCSCGQHSVAACCAAGTHVGALAWPFNVDL